MNDFDEQAEAERLRQLRARIEALLREFDVCASVFLAGRGGRLEVFQHVDASWSVLRLETLPNGNQGLRLRSQAADYGGDVARQRQEQAWGAGVISGLAEIMALTAIPWLEVAQLIDQATGATHTRDA